MEAKQTRIIKGVAQAVLMVTLGYVIRHQVAATHAPVWIAAGWLLTAWVVLKLAVVFKGIFVKFRAHTATGINLANMDSLTAATVPPWSRGYYQIEKRAYRDSWRAITRQALAPVGDFSVAGGPNGKLRTVGLLLLVFACAALAAAYLPSLVVTFWPRLFAFAGAGYAVLYAVIWIIGERRSLKEGGHRIAGDTLILDLGIRRSGALALDSIAACEVIAPGAPAVAAADAWTVSPGERINVLITLKRTTALSITSLGSPREISKRYVALYVDQPRAFAHAVMAAVKKSKVPACGVDQA